MKKVVGVSWLALARPLMQVNKVVFLDIDGVLHPVSAAHCFHDSCMGALRTIVEPTGASIVLSSSWQVTPALRAHADAALQASGIPSCIGQTVHPTGDGEVARVGSGNDFRVAEIWRWMVAHPTECRDGWVALDDLDLNLPSQNFVRTSAERGLTDADAQKAVRLLGGPDHSVPKLPPPRARAGEPLTKGEVLRAMINGAATAGEPPTTGSTPAR
eukprot:1243910-Prymnesium_polylepis.1